MTRKVNGCVIVNGNRLLRPSIAPQKIVATVSEPISNISLYFGIAASVLASKCGRILTVRVVIRRLRSALGSRVIRQRGRLESVVASLATLTVVANLLFGIPVVGVVYVSRLT